MLLLTAIALGSQLQSAGLKAKLQAIADAKATKYDCDISIAVQTGTEAVAVASNGSDVSGRFVWGSVTKQFTGTALLQLMEAGTLDLDEPVERHLNPILRQLGLRSLTALFGKEAAKITARHLAMMQSGVPDYDTAKPYPRPPKDPFRAEVYATPSKDWGPKSLINQTWVATGSLAFSPGSYTAYSSTNFVLLGLLLAQLTNSAAWDAYDQRTIFAPLPPARRALYSELKFGVHGPPANYTSVHGYDRTSYNGGDPSARPGKDVWEVAGVYGGWTASDVTASVADIARFGYDLYGKAEPQLLKDPTARQIMVPPAPQGKGRAFPYGFATFNLTEMVSGRSSAGPYRTAYGHLGATCMSLGSSHPPTSSTLSQSPLLLLTHRGPPCPCRDRRLPVHPRLLSGRGRLDRRRLQHRAGRTVAAERHPVLDVQHHPARAHSGGRGAVRIRVDGLLWRLLVRQHVRVPPALQAVRAGRGLALQGGL